MARLAALTLLLFSSAACGGDDETAIQPPELVHHPTLVPGVELLAPSIQLPGGRDAGATPDPDLPRFVPVSGEAGLLSVPVDHHRQQPYCLFDSILTPDGDDMCFPEWFTGSAAAGDVDGDGLVDLYVTSVDGRDALWRNLGDGRFDEVAQASGIPVVRSSAGRFGDVDGDGDLDLYVTAIVDKQHYLFINDGTGAFTEEGRARGASLFDGWPQVGMNSAFGDYDRDGDLDLYVTEWRPTLEIHDAGFRSRLLRNRGPAEPGHFEDVTEEAGVSFEWVLGTGEGGPGVFAFSPAFVDLDDDGHQDLAIAADFGTSRLFWNDGDGTFTDGTETSRVGTAENAMGSTFGDFDGDGDLDWFVTSIWNPPWRPAVPDSGNRLFRNLGGRRFIDATDYAGVRRGGWGWGTAFFDFDNDGDVDLAMTNGWWAEPYFDDPSYLWLNEGRLEPMRDVSVEAGFLSEGQGRGLLPIDYDADGDLDVLLTHNAGPLLLYRNDGGNERSWLRVRLRGTSSNTEGLGARITIRRADGVESVQHIGAATHFNAQMDRVAHFGLGVDEAEVREIRVRWPGGGAEQVLRDVAPRQEIVITEP